MMPKLVGRSSYEQFSFYVQLQHSSAAILAVLAIRLF